MLWLRQTPYTKVVKKIIKYQCSGNVRKIKESLVFLFDTLLDLLSDIDDNKLIFSDFVYDKDMLFAGILNKLSQVGPDVEIHTNGLLAQILNEINVKNYQEISDNIKNAILDIHSRLSSNKAYIEESNKLRDLINISKDLIT